MQCLVSFFGGFATGSSFGVSFTISLISKAALVKKVFGAGAAKLLFVRLPARYDAAGGSAFAHLGLDEGAAANLVEDVELAPACPPKKVGPDLPVHLCEEVNAEPCQVGARAGRDRQAAALVLP